MRPVIRYELLFSSLFLTQVSGVLEDLHYQRIFSRISNSRIFYSTISYSRLSYSRLSYSRISTTRQSSVRNEEILFRWTKCAGKGFALQSIWVNLIVGNCLYRLAWLISLRLWLNFLTSFRFEKIEDRSRPCGSTEASVIFIEFLFLFLKFPKKIRHAWTWNVINNHKEKYCFLLKAACGAKTGKPLAVVSYCTIHNWS